MAQKNTLDRLLDTILEKATSEGRKSSLHENPYRVDGYTDKFDPLFQDKAGYAMRLGEYKVFVLETTVKMYYPGDSPRDKPLLPDDNGKRMYLAVKKKNTIVMEAVKFIWESKLLNDDFEKWRLDYNKAAETLLKSIC